MVTTQRYVITLTFIVIFIQCPLSAAVNNLVTTPEDLVSIEGENVTMTCSVDGLELGHSVKWVKNGIPFSMGVQVISILGVIDSTRTTVVPVGLVYTLRIENVDVTFDKGLYQCCVATSGGQCGDTSLPANFTVLAIGPKCVLESDNVIEGQNISMLCQSRNGDPLKTLSWHVQEFGTVESVFWTDNQYVYLRLFWTPTRNDTGMEFDCTMSQDGIVEDKCTLGPFDIQYPPTAEIIPRKPTVTAFQDTITFHCNVNANPPINTLLWWYGAELLIDGTSEPGRFSVNGHIFQVSSFTDSDDGAIVKCTVYNGVGYNTAEVNITANILSATTSHDNSISTSVSFHTSSSFVQSTNQPSSTIQYSPTSNHNIPKYAFIIRVLGASLATSVASTLVIVLIRRKVCITKCNKEDKLDESVYMDEYQDGGCLDIHSSDGQGSDIQAVYSNRLPERQPVGECLQGHGSPSLSVAEYDTITRHKTAHIAYANAGMELSPPNPQQEISIDVSQQEDVDVATTQEQTDTADEHKYQNIHIRDGLEHEVLPAEGDYQALGEMSTNVYTALHFRNED